MFVDDISILGSSPRLRWDTSHVRSEGRKNMSPSDSENDIEGTILFTMSLMNFSSSQDNL
jgi:hypothetical protein